MVIRRRPLFGPVKLTIATLGAALFALLSSNHLIAASHSSVSFLPATMPAITTIDDRFESYNVEMAEVIGGKFCKVSTAMSTESPLSIELRLAPSEIARFADRPAVVTGSFT